MLNWRPNDRYAPWRLNNIRRPGPGSRKLPGRGRRMVRQSGEIEDYFR